jgi:hypothetical protein
MMFEVAEKALARLKHNRCDDKYVVEEVLILEAALSQIREEDEISSEVITDLQKELK